MATFAMLAAWGARSEAAVICVPSASVSPDCQANFVTVQAALNSAKSNAGHDEIRLGASAGYSGDLTYDDTTPGNTIDIIGTGQTPSDTVLTMGDTSGNNEGFRFVSIPGSTIRNLTYRIPANADGGTDHGLYLGSVTADEIVVDGPNASAAQAIRCNDCNVTDSVIDLPVEDGTFGIDQDGGSAYVADSVIKADFGVRHGSPSLTTTVERSRITAHSAGASADQGNLDISNTLIQLDGNPNAVGINLYNPNLGNSPIGATLDHLTIISGGGENSVGVRAIADNSGEGVDATLTNSVIHGFYGTGEHTLELSASQGMTVKFHTNYSAYDNAFTSNSTGPNGGTVDYNLGNGHLDLENGVSFVDPQNGNFTPSLLGGLLDGGDPTDPAPAETDINGNPRACHGTDEGVIRRDIGAFEARTVVGSDPDDCTYPVTSILAGPPSQTTNRTPAFTFATTKNPGTYLCSWDGQPAVGCAFNATAPDLGLGSHSVSVRTRDQYGNIDQTPETFNYEVIEEVQPTCETDPSLCPVVDKTAPKVLGLKAPGKTRAAKVTVRFRSDEKGVTFTCRLNKGKAMKCKSPWKTPRLKNGKNTIAIQAIDKAGNKSKVVKRVIRRVAKRR